MDRVFAELGLPNPKCRIWSTISGLLDRSWFKRLWVLQEVALAKQLEVFCGSVTIVWDVLVNLPKVVYKHRLVRLPTSILRMKRAEKGLICYGGSNRVETGCL
jgi:hypothetical protein